VLLSPVLPEPFEGKEAVVKVPKYTWKTAELPLLNTVEEFVPYERLAWSSVHREVDGPTAYHGWVITPKGAGCHLLTEETQQGPFWLELARKSPGVLYQFHQDWVETLGRAAEKEASEGGPLTSQVFCREPSFNAPIARLTASAGSQPPWAQLPQGDKTMSNIEKVLTVFRGIETDVPLAK
jgi:hypothetical protein